jgi:hypothetical protein
MFDLFLASLQMPFIEKTTTCKKVICSIKMDEL